MKRTLSMFGALAVAAIGFLFAAPEAHAAFGTKTETHGGVTCRTWIGGSNTYPMDDTHYWVCWATPLAQRANSIATTVQGLGATGNIRVFLQNQDVTYYYFINRSDMNAYMAAKFPLEPQFQSQTARCGKTGYNTLSGRIITSVFDLCTYDQNISPPLPPPAQVSNADLPKVAAHESGHAFDWAWRKSQGGVPNAKGPSESTAFKTLGDFDYNRLLPCNWNGPGCTPQKPVMTTAQKVNYICGALFKTFAASQLERDLGAVNNQVCTNSTTINPYYTTNGVIPKDPRVIALERIPYFITTAGGAGSPLYQELFAEEFARLALDGGPLLKMTDQIINGGTGGVNFPAFACTRWAIRMFWVTNNPPPLTGPDSLGQHDSCINNPGSWTN